MCKKDLKDEILFKQSYLTVRAQRIAKTSRSRDGAVGRRVTLWQLCYNDVTSARPPYCLYRRRSEWKL